MAKTPPNPLEEGEIPARFKYRGYCDFGASNLRYHIHLIRAMILPLFEGVGGSCREKALNQNFQKNHQAPTMKKTILITAYAVHPGKGSEDGIGWNIIRSLAAGQDIVAITRKNNRPHIERHLREHPLPECRSHTTSWA